MHGNNMERDRWIKLKLKAKDRTYWINPRDTMLRAARGLPMAS
jgi:hypothetical protein